MTPAEAVERFMPQIKQAARNAAGDYPSIREAARPKDSESFTPAIDALGVAAERVMLFADNGQLAEWEEKTDGDQNQLDRYVYWALYYDLVDYARKVISSDDRANLTGRYRPKTGSVGDWAEPGTGDLSEYPLLRMNRSEGLTQAEIAKDRGVSVDTIQRQIQREVERFLASVPEEMLAAA